jgi:hypothetical protein
VQCCQGPSRLLLPANKNTPISYKNTPLFCCFSYVFWVGRRREGWEMWHSLKIASDNPQPLHRIIRSLKVPWHEIFDLCFFFMKQFRQVARNTCGQVKPVANRSQSHTSVCGYPHDGYSIRGNSQSKRCGLPQSAAHIWAWNVAIDWNPAPSILHRESPFLKCHIGIFAARLLEYKIPTWRIV